MSLIFDIGAKLTAPVINSVFKKVIIFSKNFFEKKDIFSYETR